MASRAPSNRPSSPRAAPVAPPPRLLTVARTAEHLQVSEKTVRRLIAGGALRAHRLGGCVRIAEDDLALFLNRRRS